MKNQNFGDNRDLLKFDLVYQIAKKGLVDHFTYIPMLTKDETLKEEPEICRYEATGGSQNKDLMDFFNKSIINEKRDIGQIEEFFKQGGIPVSIYGKNKSFTHKGRVAYFKGIKNGLLAKSLILIDPDKGLEEKRNGDGNLLYSEARDIYDRMDEESYLMFTQRFPDDMYEEYLGKRVAEIKDRIPGSQPITIDDLDSVLIFLTGNKDLQDRLVNLLREYTQTYAKKTE